MVKAVQAIRFLIAGIVLHQSLTGHMFLYGRLTIAAMSSGSHSIRVGDSPTILSFRSGCGYWSFVTQQIGLRDGQRVKKIQVNLMDCVKFLPSRHQKE